MSTPVKDPFDDLLDLGGDSPPPLPTSQPPQSDSWMVLPDGADDFKSVTEDDLFGGACLTTSQSTKSSTKAHGSTFDDLFGEGSSHKKTKKSSTGHGATFDDLFGDDTSTKSIKNGNNTFEELFPDEVDTKPVLTPSNKNCSNMDDIFGSPSNLKSDSVVSRKDAASTLDDLFGTTEKPSPNKNTEESLDDLFGSSSVKEKTENISSVNKDSLEDLFASSVKTLDTPSKEGKDLMDELSLTTQKVEHTETVEVPKPDKDLDDLFGQVEKKSRPKRSPPGPTFDELFGGESPSEKVEDDLFGTPKKKTSEELPDKKSEKSLDELFGQTSAKSNIDDLFGGAASSEVKVSSADKTEKLSSASNDLDDLIFNNTPPSTSVADDSVVNGRAAASGTDTVDAKVDILISAVDEKAKRTSSSDVGDQEDFDFSVIQDTSLLDMNITRHRSSVRRSGSLALRKKPTRKHIHKDGTDGDDLFASPTKPDEDKDEDENKTQPNEEAEQSTSQYEKEEKAEEEAPLPVKKSPMAGGKLLIGPDVLAQSQLMKGIASKRGRPSAVNQSDRSTAIGAKAEPDKSEITHKPVIKPSKPQITPRPKLSPTSDFKADTEIQSTKRPMDSKPDVVAVMPRLAKPDVVAITPNSSKPDLVAVPPNLSILAADNKESEKNSAFSAVLKPTPTNVPQSSTNKLPSVTLEKVTLRSTRSSSSPQESKVTSPSSENNVIHSELAERKNSLRRVSPAKNKESDEPKEEKKSQPTWLREMKLRSTPRNSPDVTSSKVTDTRSPVKDDVDNVRLSNIKPTVTPRIRDVESSRALETKPQLAKRPVIDRSKPKIEASKPVSMNGKGDARSSLGVKEVNTSSSDVPSWKRELAERKKKKKDDPVQSTPPKSETPPDVASNWRTQLSQKKRRPVHTPAGDVKVCPESKQPEWAMQAEQRRARLVKSGLIGQK